MPVDGGGNYRHNVESARMHDRAEGREPGEAGAGNVHELHDHGDGTFTTKHPEHGEVEHESLGHALAHIAHAHKQDGHKHMHIHHDGETVHAHQVNEDGANHEEHDPQNLDTLHDSMSQFLNEEKGEGEKQGEQHEGGLGELY